jgi:hypothetical protein
MTDIVERLRGFKSTSDALKAADEIESLRQQLADTEALRVCANEDANQLAHEANVLAKQLGECQAREKVLRDALGSAIDNRKRFELLSMPSDSTALDTILKEAKREALLDVADWLVEQHGRKHEPEELRRMANELAPKPQGWNHIPVEPDEL